MHTGLHHCIPHKTDQKTSNYVAEKAKDRAAMSSVNRLDGAAADVHGPGVPDAGCQLHQPGQLLPFQLVAHRGARHLPQRHLHLLRGRLPHHRRRRGPLELLLPKCQRWHPAAAQEPTAGYGSHVQLRVHRLPQHQKQYVLWRQGQQCPLNCSCNWWPRKGYHARLLPRHSLKQPRHLPDQLTHPPNWTTTIMCYTNSKFICIVPFLLSIIIYY